MAEGRFPYLILIRKDFVNWTLSGVHLVCVSQCVNEVVPHPLISPQVHIGFADHTKAKLHLFFCAARLGIKLESIFREIPHHEIEDLVQKVCVEIVDFRIFQYELAIDHTGEQLSQDQQEIYVLCLLDCGRRSREEFLEGTDLLLEDF